MCCNGCFKTNHIVIPEVIPSWKAITDDVILTSNRSAFFQYEGRQWGPERQEVLTCFRGEYKKVPLNDSYFMLTPAGLGVWSARFLNALQFGVVPVITTDGVIKPFER